MRDEHRVLDANSTPAWNIDPRLIGNQHILLQRDRTGLRKTRLLVDLKSKAMPEPMTEILGKILLNESIACHTVCLNPCDAGMQCRECTLLRREHGIIALALMRICPSDTDGPRDV